MTWSRRMLQWLPVRELATGVWNYMSSSKCPGSDARDVSARKMCILHGYKSRGKKHEE